jgi:hypothetical protein
MASFAPIAAMISRNQGFTIGAWVRLEPTVGPIAAHEEYWRGWGASGISPDASLLNFLQTDDRWRRTTKFANGSAAKF